MTQAELHPEPSTDDWALAIGRFIMAFAGLEDLTWRYVRTFGSPRVAKATERSQLAPRAKLALALVLDRGVSGGLEERLRAAFDEISSLAGERNIVAHNGLNFEIYLTDDDQQVKVVACLQSPGGKEVKYVDLEHLTARAKHVSIQLIKMLAEVGLERVARER